MRQSVVLLAIVSSFLFSGCATAFMGSAHVEGGRAGCERKCAGQGMACTGMVYMGEYSSACVCEVPGAGGRGNAAAAAAAGGAAGVAMQMRAQQQRSATY